MVHQHAAGTWPCQPPAFQMSRVCAAAHALLSPSPQTVFKDPETDAVLSGVDFYFLEEDGGRCVDGARCRRAQPICCPRRLSHVRLPFTFPPPPSS